MQLGASAEDTAEETAEARPDVNSQVSAAPSDPPTPAVDTLSNVAHFSLAPSYHPSTASRIRFFHLGVPVELTPAQIPADMTLRPSMSYHVRLPPEVMTHVAATREKALLAYQRLLEACAPAPLAAIASIDSTASTASTASSTASNTASSTASSLEEALAGTKAFEAYRFALATYSQAFCTCL